MASTNIKNTFSFATRALSDNMKLSLLSLSPEAINAYPKNCVYLISQNYQDTSVYADMVSKLWDMEGQPPWAFINKYEDFRLLDRDNNTEIIHGNTSKTTASSVPCRKRLPARNTKWLIMGLLCFGICIITFCILANIITKRRAVSNIIAEAVDFIQINKNISEDGDERNNAINHCDEILAKIDSIDSNNDPLIDYKSKLHDWKTKAKDLDLIFSTIDQRLSSYHHLSLPLILDMYPDPNYMNKLIVTKNDLSKYKENYASIIGEMYNSKTGEAINNIDDYIQKSALLLKNMSTAVEGVPYLHEIPSYYDPNKYQVISESSKILVRIEDSNSLKYAKVSPYTIHAEDANILYNNISHKKQVYMQCITEMDKYLEDSKHCVQKAKNQINKEISVIVNDPNCITIINAAIAQIENAKRLNPTLYKINTEIADVRHKIISIIEKKGDLLKSIPKGSEGQTILDMYNEKRKNAQG